MMASITEVTWILQGGFGALFVVLFLYTLRRSDDRERRMDEGLKASDARNAAQLEIMRRQGEHLSEQIQQTREQSGVLQRLTAVVEVLTRKVQ